MHSTLPLGNLPTVLFMKQFKCYASLVQAISGVMPLVLCPLVVSQAPQHFRPSETQAACGDHFARQSICTVIFLHSGMAKTVHPLEV